MSKLKPSFLTISIPDVDWLHDLIHNYNQSESTTSLSHHLVELVGKDLHKRSILTTAQWNQIRQLTGMKTKPTEPRKFKNLSWYIPYPVLEWLPEKISEIAKSRSYYVWNLFIKEHRHSIPAELLAEWGDPEKPDLTAFRVQLRRTQYTAEQIKEKLEMQRRALYQQIGNIQRDLNTLNHPEKPKKPNRKAS